MIENKISGNRDADTKKFEVEYDRLFECILRSTKGKDFLGRELKDLSSHIPEMQYFFSWDDITGNDSDRFKEFLEQKYGINWVREAKIEKIDDGMSIIVSTEKNSLLLKINYEKTKLNLKIDDNRADEFNVNTRNGKLYFEHSRTEPARYFIERKREAWKEELKELRAELNRLSSFIPKQEKDKLEEMLKDVEGCFDTGKESEQIWKLYQAKDRIKWLKRVKKAVNQ